MSNQKDVGPKSIDDIVVYAASGVGCFLSTYVPIAGLSLFAHCASEKVKEPLRLMYSYSVGDQAETILSMVGTFGAFFGPVVAMGIAAVYAQNTLESYRKKKDDYSKCQK